MSTKEKQLEFATRMRARISEYWLVDKGNRTNDARRKQVARDTEEYAQVILKEMGFQYILPLNNTTKCAKYLNHNVRTVFPFFDYYAEKDGEKWFIDVTAYIKKWLPHTPLWERLGVKMAVLFIRRDLKQYCFREDTGSICIALRLKDIGLAPLSVSEARKKSWETRHQQGNDQGWNKGKTAQDDPRIAHQAEARRGGHNPAKHTTRKGIKWSDEAKARYVPWCKGLTKETDKRIAKRSLLAGDALRGKPHPHKGRLSANLPVDKLPIV